MAEYSFRLTNLPTAEVYVVGPEEEPIGWAETEFTLKRDEVFHGVFTDFSLDVGFIRGGFDFLNRIHTTYGLAADVEVQVSERESEFDAWAVVFTGRLNMGGRQLDYSEGFGQFRANIEQAGALQTVLNRMDTPIDLLATVTLDGTAVMPYVRLPYDVNMVSHPTPHTLRVSTDYEFGTYQTLGNGSTPPASRLIYDDKRVDELVIAQDGTWVLPTGFNQGRYYQNTTGVALIGEQQVKVRMQLHLFGPALGGEYDEPPYNQMIDAIMIELRQNDVIFFTHTILPPVGPAWARLSTGETIYDITADFVVPFNVAPGDYLNAAIRWTQTNPATPFLVLFARLDSNTNNELAVLVGNLDPVNPAVVKWSLINEALARATELISDNQYTVYSDYFGRTDAEPLPTPTLNGCGAFTAVTNGYLLRQFPTLLQDPTNGRPFFTSLKKLLEAMAAIWNVGFTPDFVQGRDVLRVEATEFFYPNVQMLAFNNVDTKAAELKIMDRQAALFGTFETGYAEFLPPEEFSMLDEFNTKRSYRPMYENLKTTFKRVCEFIGAEYLIELTKRQHYETTGTKDWKYDEDTFVLATGRNLFSLDTPEYGVAGAANLFNPSTVVNWRLSPTHMARRWLNLLAQIIIEPANPGGTTSNPTTGPWLKFASGEKNITASGSVVIPDGCTVDNVFTTQNQDFDGTVGRSPRFLLPEFVEFKAPITFAEYNAIKAAPLGYITVQTNEGAVFSGYLAELKFKPGDTSQFKLLRRRP